MSDFKRVHEGGQLNFGYGPIECIAPEDIDPCYGLEKLTVNKRDLLALCNGDKLYAQVNEGEYAILISLEDAIKYV